MDELLVKKLKEYIKKELKKKYTPREIEKSLLNAGFDKAGINKAFEDLKIKKPGLLGGIIRAGETKPKPKPAKKKKSFFSKLFTPAVKKPKEKKQVKVSPPPKPKTKPERKKESFLSKLLTPRKKPAAQKKQPARKKIHLHFFAKLVSALLIMLIILAVIILLFSPASCATKECFLKNANACKRATYQNTIAGAHVNYESKPDCTIVKTVVKVADTEPTEIKEKFKGKSMVCAYYENDFSPMHIETLSGLIVNCEGPLKQALIQYIT